MAHEISQMFWTHRSLYELKEWALKYTVKMVLHEQAFILLIDKAFLETESSHLSSMCLLASKIVILVSIPMFKNDFKFNEKLSVRGLRMNPESSS